MGYEPIVVLSQADRECADCVSSTLGEYRVLSGLKAKVRALAAADVPCSSGWHLQHAHIAVLTK